MGSVGAGAAHTHGTESEDPQPTQLKGEALSVTLRNRAMELRVDS